MSGCIFCKIAAGEIPAALLYEDERVVVFRDIAPKAEVHLLLVPRAHIESLAHTTAAEDGLLTHMLHLLPTLAQGQGLHAGFRTIINTGKGGGQEVPHLHIHLLGGDRLPGF